MFSISSFLFGFGFLLAFICLLHFIQIYVPFVYNLLELNFLELLLVVVLQLFHEFLSIN